ncbi:hypothetical protein D3C85_1478410 [compost metagenome]
MKNFKRDVSKIKAWAVVDSEVGFIDVFPTRELARLNKRYAAEHGHKQVVVKLTFDSVVR